MRHGFYKLNIYVNDVVSTYCYYDDRNCDFPNNPNCFPRCGNGNDITLRYDAGLNRIWTFNGATADKTPPSEQNFWIRVQQEGVILWSAYKNCASRCFQPFWDNGLVLLTKVGNQGYRVPHLIWGPYSTFTPTGYKIYWAPTNGGAPPPQSFSLLADVGSNTTEYTHQGIPLVGHEYTAYYKIQAYNTTQTSGFTNTVNIDYGNNPLKPNHGDTQADPVAMALANVFPNPFNPTTIIKYDLPTSSHVSLKIFNTLGQEVTTLVDDVQDAGYKSVEFNASNLASGVYFYRLQAGDFVQTKKFVLLR
jgi:hypothetical protein